MSDHSDDPLIDWADVYDPPRCPRCGHWQCAGAGGDSEDCNNPAFAPYSELEEYEDPLGPARGCFSALGIMLVAVLVTFILFW